MESPQVSAFTFIMPLDGATNSQVFVISAFPDTVSMNDLGDFTGLVACGERIYEV